jgi:hypothetical protein
MSTGHIVEYKNNIAYAAAAQIFLMYVLIVNKHCDI